MPANLSPEYKAAADALRRARDPQQRLDCLRQMLSVIPKHKGTDHLQADLKHRIKELDEELEGPKRGGARSSPSLVVRPEGAAQIALVGPPNSGKSSLHARLTGSGAKSGPYPHTTQYPEPGMLKWEDVHFQLVDLPAISSAHPLPWLGSTLQSADACLLVVDLSDPALLEDLETTLGQLGNAKVQLGQGPMPEVTGWMAKKTLLVGNKLDAAGAADDLEILKELYGARFPILALSAETGEGLDGLRRAAFDLLELVRVYTKAPGKKMELTAPYVLRRGSRLVDLAAHVHHDFLTQLKYARIWGHGRFEGQMVNRDYLLADKDVVELHR